MESRRLYIGGISDSVLENDIKAKFGEFGQVKNVEIRCKENYGSRRYFAYIDIEADSKSIDKCVHQCNNLEWKGGHLKVQPAKESFLQKTQKEIFESKVQPEAFNKTNASQSGFFAQQWPHHERTNAGGPSRHSNDERMEVDDTDRHHYDKKRGSNSHHEAERHRASQTPKSWQENDGHDQNDGHRGGKRKSWKDSDQSGDRYAGDWNADRYRQQAREHFRQKREWNEQRRRDHGHSSGMFSADRANRTGDAVSQGRDNDQRFHGGQRDNARPGGFAGRDELSISDRDTSQVDAFESQRNDLFEDIDAADEIGQLEDEMPDLDGDGENDEGKRGHDGHVKDTENDPISESNLKELFDGVENQGFTLSSLFADRLKVDDLPSSDEEEEANQGGRSPRRRRRDSDGETQGAEERFGEDYWRRAEGGEKVHQKSWEEMRHRPTDSVAAEQRTKSGTRQSFFFLPGDQRLNEGLEVFQTDADPSQFIDAWCEQAEQLSLRLFQRKANTRAQHQMTQRLSGAGRGLQNKSSKISVRF